MSTVEFQLVAFVTPDSSKTQVKLKYSQGANPLGILPDATISDEDKFANEDLKVKA